MTGQDLLMLVVVSATLGAVFGRIALRQSPFFESKWGDALFFVVMAAAAAVIYGLLAAREIREEAASVRARALPSAFTTPAEAR